MPAARLPRMTADFTLSAPAVEALALTKVYRTGTRANDGITLTVRRGEVFGLLGPNGAGKSTFVQQVQGLLKPTSGTVRVFGIDAARHPDAVKRSEERRVGKEGGSRGARWQ